MFIFNPKLTFRNLLRHRSATMINISGFTIGLVAAVFLYFYISEELESDSFHARGNDIYRVIRVSAINGTPYRIGVTSGPFARALENDFPMEISAVTRALPTDGLVAYGEKKFMEEKLLFADKNFFRFFSFPLAQGAPAIVLDQPNSVVISKEIARKYFGEKDPTGEILEVDNKARFIVTGIMDAFPSKSHLEFDMVFSLEYYDQAEWMKGWWNNSLFTYVHVPDERDKERLKTQLPQFVDKYFAADFERTGARIDLELEPLKEVYFNHETRYDRVEHGNFKAVSILALVALAILAIACFNYVNLSIAQSFRRAKEVGVRKVMGGEKSRLILQLLGESLLILLISILLAIGLSELLLPSFNRYFGLEVDLNWLDPNVFVFFLGLILFVLLTSGLYPAVLLSSFKPVSVLKGGKVSVGKNLFVRKGLVITQFVISIFMIAVTILISSQLTYMNSKELGFNKDAVILVKLNNQAIQDNQETFKDQLLLNSTISGVTGLSGEPGGFHDATVFQVNGMEGNYRMRTVFTDTEYLNVFDVEVVAGRNFSTEYETDETTALMINQKALTELGLTAEEVIGKRVELPSWNNGLERTVIGVVADYHFASLKDNIEPLAIIMGGRHRRVAIKTNTTDLKETLLAIDEVYNRFSPDFPLSYEFLDQSLERLYENEQKQARVFTAFSGISIFLACLGIFGLAAYSARQRQKELGIRKVLGAAPLQILGLISKEFILLVAIAALVATPLAWLFVEDWLGAFAYRIEVLDHWPVFVVSGLIAILIALLTIGFKTYKAAVSNPTESIRYE